MEKVLRLKKAFEYLRSCRTVHTQAEVADTMGASRPNVSSALKGDSRALTDKFLKRFAKAFPIISADWLLTGEGPMLTTADDVDGADLDVSQQSSGDHSPNVNGSGNVVGGAVEAERLMDALSKAMETIQEQQRAIARLLEERMESKK